MQISPAQLKKIVIASGFITEAAFDDAEKSSSELGMSLSNMLIFRGLISEQALGQLIAEHFNVPFITIGNQIISPDLLALIPEKIARNYQLIPFENTAKGLKVAMIEPSNFEAIEFIKRQTGLNILPYFSVDEDLHKALGQYKRNIRQDFAKIISKNLKKTTKITNADDLLKKAEDVPIIKIFNTILEYAIAESTSDIHMERQSEKVMIRFRIDGVLRDIIALPKWMESALVARIKILANLKIDEHRIPQDGRYKYNLGNEIIAFRVSIIPGYYGENIVLRLLPETNRPSSLEELGYGGKNLKWIKREITRPHGMVLVTGPTGSGKTTSLYSVLNMLNNVGVKICTIEDPIEYGLNRVLQIQVNNKSGLTFSQGLRALLRHDPDIIMVGEIRDHETAEIAVHSALTGHLVLTTLHTNDAAGAVPRLLDMGVESYLLASTLNVVIAQRLVRRICQNCLISDQPKPETIDYFHKTLHKDISKQKFYRGQGCDECGHTGYKGRIGIYEILRSSEEIRKLVVQNAGGDAIKKQAEKEGMINMLEDGLNKVASGLTTITEVLRAVRE